MTYSMFGKDFRIKAEDSRGGRGGEFRDFRRRIDSDSFIVRKVRAKVGGRGVNDPPRSRILMQVFGERERARAFIDQGISD